MKTYYSAQEVQALLTEQQLSDPIELALSLLPQAASHAVTPVSQFHVGAIAIDREGNFYLGANQECAHAAIAQTIHAEQSAVAHAWMCGASELAHIVVNYTPCGHCRQFLNELRGAEHLLIHLPHSRDNRLHAYLPDSFGAGDLGITTKLLDPQNHAFVLSESNDLVQSALRAANASHAPYSHAYAGVALHMRDGQQIIGCYAENAAYNPSLPPLQTAINFLRLNGYAEQDVVAVALVCTEHGGHVAHTSAFLTALGIDAPLQVVYLPTPTTNPQH